MNMGVLFLMLVSAVTVCAAEDQINASLEIMAKKIETLEKDNQKITNLVVEVENVKNENNELKSKMMLLTSELGELQDKYDDENQELKVKYGEAVNEIEKIRKEDVRPNSVFVAFTAYPSENRTYVDGEHVMFDVAIRNYGTAYSTALSTFECPISGYYMFFVNLFTKNNQYIYAQIYIDSQDGEPSLPYTYSPVYIDNASSFVVVHCTAETLVWVEAVGNGGTLNRDSYSHFTGALLYADPAI